jgi:hypothetical protein
MLREHSFRHAKLQVSTLHPTYIAGESGSSLLAIAHSQFTRCSGPFANFEWHPCRASLDYVLDAKRIGPALTGIADRVFGRLFLAWMIASNANDCGNA